MAPRWIALTIGLAMLGIVGVFVWAVIRPPAPPAPGSEATAAPPAASEKRVAGAAGPWTLYARAVPGAGRAVTVTVSAKDLEGRPVVASVSPVAVLRMLDMPMEPEGLVLVQEGSGAWRGSARLSMAGRWNLQVRLNGETLNLPFESR